MEGIKNSPQSPEVPVYTAKDMLTNRWRRGRSPGIRPPETVILTYQPTLLNYTARVYPVQKVGGFFGDLYLLRGSGGRLAVSGNFGIGAPAAAMVIEELAAFGIRRVVTVGLAGSLQPDLLPGDVILCNAAYRDEGTSAHYSPAGEIVQASGGMVGRLEKALQTRGIQPRVGSSWTTDAPYRETWSKVDRFRRAGLLSVEMEAAAVFAVGQALQLETGAVLVVADPLLRRSWNTREEEKRVSRALQTVMNCLAGSFLQGNPG